MKKLLALLLVAVLMATCGTALAEPSAALTVAVMDPIIYYNGEPMLDMTGLALDLTGFVSDAGVFAATLGAYAGETYETDVAYAQAQLDANGLTFWVDGISNLYSVDLAQYLNGFDVTTLLPSIPAYTALTTAAATTEATEVDLSLPVRYALVNSMIADFTTDGAISIDKTAGELIVNNLLTMIETSGADVDGLAELRSMRLAFDLTGTIAVDGDPSTGSGSYTIDGEGYLYSAESDEAIPYTLTFTDSAEALNLNVNADDESDAIALVVSSDFTAGAHTVATLSANGAEVMTFEYSATPVEGSRQVDYVISLDAPTEELSMSILLSNNNNGDDLGFALDLFLNEGTDSYGAYLYYSGEKLEDETSTALNGFVSLGGEYNEESYGFDAYLVLQNAACDTTEWVYDSTGAIAIETLSETDAASLQTGLMGVLGTAGTVIMENVPGLASYVSAMMGDMAA